MPIQNEENTFKGVVHDDLIGEKVHKTLVFFSYADFYVFNNLDIVLDIYNYIIYFQESIATKT